MLQESPDALLEPVLRAAEARPAGVHAKPPQCGWPHNDGYIHWYSWRSCLHEGRARLVLRLWQQLKLRLTLRLKL